jgi:hypothetical protein
LDYDQWLARNALYRTAPVSQGGTVADRVDSIHASLYTFYYDRFPVETDYHQVTFNSLNDRLTVADTPFDGVQKIVLRRTDDAQLPQGLKQWQEYYVVNASGHSFQISESENGPPIDIAGEWRGDVYVQGTQVSDRMLYDRNVRRDWAVYAEENIAEARKYGKKV